MTDGRWQNPSALTSSVICPPNVTHVPTETRNVGVRTYTKAPADSRLADTMPVWHMGFCTRKKWNMAKKSSFLTFRLSTSAFTGNSKMYPTTMSTQLSSQLFYKFVWMQQIWVLPNPRQDTRRPDFPRFLSTQIIALALKQHQGWSGSFFKKK